jgi:quinol monooxygenase YgiN
VRLSRLEAGCQYYSLGAVVDGTTPGEHVIVELWESPEAWNAHKETEHFKRLLPQLEEYSANLKLVGVGGGSSHYSVAQ